ncbi:hypothetical protein VARIO8X_60344 [Burkholderiales bacterium 8X]|nr:hypothetical protein VARIO8X_60344 [Burkholderiales bacterium 8X]
MIWRKVTEDTIGGNYTWYDSAIHGQELLPLLYCVGNAFPARDRKEFWYYVSALFTPNETKYAGGDPGWRLIGCTSVQGRTFYSASVNSDISGLETTSGEYDESTVKYYFVRTMREYSRVHSESREFVEQLIVEYKLEEA